MSRRAINLKVNENDLDGLRKRAIAEDQQPNDVIRSLIRAYATGKVDVVIQITPTEED